MFAAGGVRRLLLLAGDGALASSGRCLAPTGAERRTDPRVRFTHLLLKSKNSSLSLSFDLTKERVMGIEPTYPAWKAGALADVLHPHLLNYYLALIEDTW